MPSPGSVVTRGTPAPVSVGSLKPALFGSSHGTIAYDTSGGACDRAATNGHSRHALEISRRSSLGARNPRPTPGTNGSIELSPQKRPSARYSVLGSGAPL